LKQNANDALERKGGIGQRAHFGNVTGAVANGVLTFKAEQEGTGERVDIGNALLLLREILGRKGINRMHPFPYHFQAIYIYIYVLSTLWHIVVKRAQFQLPPNCRNSSAGSGNRQGQNSTRK
jgi:hypothetical protein